ncbi:TadE/TadG family type IV pilus assembly protein [Brevundimonas sp. PAMC22021]|uniref:TadE/TadG family type IV pilus assembly protein n=1 Tax=Brevundimonas sp. PAMC22021 TaxID=2861285 RepID=UPI001C628795|nr:TadE/TadG family type IV pilus assembly protein [Brevundimonas sp. PAMC22021]QYF85806.1 pilus assembly protein [Brevundimonas sp. PAMC22021]
MLMRKRLKGRTDRRAVAPLRLFRDVVEDSRGNIALKFALLGPVLALIAIGAIDVASVHSADSRLQDLADASALAGASELALAIDGAAAVQRANAMVDAGLGNWPQAPRVQKAIEVLDHNGQRVLQVHLSANRTSFFVNLLPPGGWNFEALARGSALSRTPLCVLGFNQTDSAVIRVKDSARIQAPACMVHSNRDILVEGGNINASAVQAVRSARGSIFPVAGTGAEVIPDPFATLNLGKEKICSTMLPRLFGTGTQSLAAGVHCGGVTVFGSAKLTLKPGEHWFLGGHLDVKEDARLLGDDVVLMFDKASKFDFKDKAQVNLNGRQTGTWAGMVMIATRDNTQDFIISADNVDTLQGVIYVPRAKLIVEGKSDVARDTPWTVVVARALELKGSASLFINANYQSSNVPVPDGVGPSSGPVKLVQ